MVRFLVFVKVLDILRHDVAGPLEVKRFVFDHGPPCCLARVYNGIVNVGVVRDFESHVE